VFVITFQTERKMIVEIDLSQDPEYQAVAGWNVSECVEFLIREGIEIPDYSGSPAALPHWRRLCREAIEDRVA
jgi:hypothetical protein